MKTISMEDTMSPEHRSTAYYYGDLERIKRSQEPSPRFKHKRSVEQNEETEKDLRIKEDDLKIKELELGIKDLKGFEVERELLQQDIRLLEHSIRRKRQELKPKQPEDVAWKERLYTDKPQNLKTNKHVETNDVIDQVPIKEVPPLRDRQWSLPEYSTPENSRVDPRFPENPNFTLDLAKYLEGKPQETYSTAGTFPMPKEREPLLSELETVGRVPLSQLEPGVRRSRSWYLCCPGAEGAECAGGASASGGGAEGDHSWRYSSLRGAITQAPRPNGHYAVTTQSSNDVASLRSERDSLARALANERARSAAAARAHDARLAELHGVIAELVRRRTQDKQARAIPEEDVSDECESTTQPAGELDNDADRSRTDQNEESSFSPELVTPRDQSATSDDGDGLRREDCQQLCLNTARCCQSARHAHAHSQSQQENTSVSSCDRERGSDDGRIVTASPGRCESRQAKLASRVRLRQSGGRVPHHRADTDQLWCAEAGAGAGAEAAAVAGAEEALGLDVFAQADLREALLTAGHEGEAPSPTSFPSPSSPSPSPASVGTWRARCWRLYVECGELRSALNTATHTAQRLSAACAVHESSSVTLCCALRSADRALETYDVLLALAETAGGEGREGGERASAELVGHQLLWRLDHEHQEVGEPLLPPGPWHKHHNLAAPPPPWEPAMERRLREHAARLKTETVSLRELQPPPHLFSYHDAPSPSPSPSPSLDAGGGSPGTDMAEMEAALLMQEMVMARSRRAGGEGEEGGGGAHERGGSNRGTAHKTSSRARKGRRHWLHTQASETDL